MRAIDTNVILRYLLRDDDEQVIVAEHVLATPCFIPVTVLLETVWVLESYFKLAREDVARLLHELLDLQTVQCSDLAVTQWALERYRHGADIGDMLHLTESRGASQFATFDRRLAKLAATNSPVPVETLGAAKRRHG